MSVSLAVRRPTGYGGTALRFVDEKRAVYVHGAGAVVLDVSTGDVDFFVCGGARGVSCVAASPNTGTLAVAKRERNPCIQVYQYPTKRLKASLRGGTDLEFVDMAFSRDGTQLAAIAALTDYKFTIWNVEDGSVVVQAKLPQSCVGVAFDPSSTADLATWGKHGVYFWKVKAVMGERELTSIKGELPDEDMVKDAMREDGDSGSGNEDGEDSADSDSEDEYGDGAAADERQADTEMEHDLQRRLGVFTAAAYGPDGSLYAANSTSAISVYDGSTGTITRSIVVDCAEECSGMALTRTHLITLWKDGMVRWIGVDDGLAIERLATTFQPSAGVTPKALSAIAIGPKFDMALVGTEDGSLHEFRVVSVDADAEAEVTVPHILPLLYDFHQGMVTASVPVLTTGTQSEPLLATAGVDGSVRVWTTSGRMCGAHFFKTTQTAEEAASGAPTAGVPVIALSSSPTLPLLAVGLGNGMLYLVYVSVDSTGEAYDLTPLHHAQLHTEPITFAAFAPDDPVLVVASSAERAAHFIDVSPAGGFAVLAVAETAAPVSAVTWSGSQALVGTMDGKVSAFAIPPAGTIPTSDAVAPAWVANARMPLTAAVALNVGGKALLVAGSPATCSVNVLALPDASAGAPAAAAPGGVAVAPVPEVNLASVFSVEVAHAKGVMAAAASPDGSLVATGSVEGQLKLWKVVPAPGGAGGVSLVLADELALATTAVTTVAFASEGATLYAAGADGSSFVVEVTGKKPGRHAPIGAALAKLAERAKLSSDKHVPAQGPTWRAELRERNAEAGALELEAQKSVSRNIVADLAHRLRELLMQNDTVDELERLDRSEFVVDVHGRDEVLRKNALAASQLRADIKANDLGKKLVAARVREECWDAMQVPRTEVHALLKPECAAENFALAKQKAAERRELECVKQMRVVELHEQREAAGHGKANKAPGVPGDVSWIVNEGALPATTEPVAAVEASGKKKDAGGAGGDAKAGAPQAGDDELGDLEDDDRDGAALPEIDASNIASLLYPPTALVTQTQQRAQIVLIAELVRQMMLKFNERFDKVMALKLDETDRIEEKNARVREILFELKSSEAFFEPAWAENERPERVLEVPEAEMMSKPYETEQMREARLAAAEEKRKREEEARKDNIGERALNDMMYGQLENKKDNLAVAEDLVAPVWMAEVAEEDYSDEQRKEADAFEATKAALAEEREKQRKALELELKKLRIEVNDIAKAFDEKVAELAERHLVVRNEMGVQELYSSRLALQVMVLDDHHVQSGALEAQIGKLETEKQALRVKVAAFAKSVETARDAMAALSEEDKQLEKDFKKEMQGVSTATIDQEGMRALLSLYRMRVVANANAGGTGSFRGSGTMNRSRAMGTSIGGADALSPGSNMRRASRFGGGTMLDVAGAMGKARRGSNFRGSSGNRMTSAGESPDSGSMKSAMARAIAKVREAEQSDHDPFKEIDDTKKRQAAAAAAPRVQALSMERDCPDGYRPEEAVWARMQELRVVKVQKEAQVKAATAKHAELKKQLDALAAVGDALSTDVTSRKALLRKLTSSMALSGEDVEVLVKLRQGQDEVEQDAVVTDYSGAMLISVAIVEKVNTSIKELGGEQVKILQRVRNSRKSINYMEWEHMLMDAKKRDFEEYYTDLQLLRVTKELQAVMKGDASNRERERAERGEARIGIMTRVHGDKCSKLKHGVAKLNGQVGERHDENLRLQAQLKDLESSVAVRESIHRSRADAGGDDAGASPAAPAARMKRIVMRRRLIDLARMQTQECEFLRQELDRLRMRTFPSFAHAARERLVMPPDELL